MFGVFNQDVSRTIKLAEHTFYCDTLKVPLILAVGRLKFKVVGDF
jgi:hypothetical protein